jgi:hypothetical protein
MPITINTNGTAITNGGCITRSLHRLLCLRILEEGGGVRPQTNRPANRIRLHPVFKMWPGLLPLTRQQDGKGWQSQVYSTAAALASRVARRRQIHRREWRSRRSLFGHSGGKYGMGSHIEFEIGLTKVSSGGVFRLYRGACQRAQAAIRARTD